MFVASPESSARRLQKQIGEAIRSARIRKGLTQAELASAAGVSRPTVVSAEGGRSVASRSLFLLLAFLQVRWPASGSAMPVHESARPTIKDLMSRERSRQQRLLATGIEAARRRAWAPEACAPSKSPGRASDHARVPTTRPRIRELMAAERRRLAGLRPEE